MVCLWDTSVPRSLLLCYILLLCGLYKEHGSRNYCAALQKTGCVTLDGPLAFSGPHHSQSVWLLNDYLTGIK